MSGRKAKADSAAVAERISACKAEAAGLKARIEARRAEVSNGLMASVPLPRRAPGPPLERRKRLEGHYGKLYAVDWAGDSARLVSAR